MQILGAILFGLGGITACVGGVWFMIVAFRESVLWGLGSLFVPFVSLVFLIMYWGEAAKPFGISVLGSFVMIVGAIMMPGFDPMPTP